MTTKIDQKEYLKKYLSGNKKKKKKDKKPKIKATVKIIDDDVHVNRNLEIDEELLLTGEDAPQIVGIINASGEPPESKWKSFGAIKKEEESDDLWGKKAIDVKTQINKSPIRKAKQLPPARRNSDQSPPRRNSDQSPPRRKRHVNENNSPSEKHSRWNSNESRDSTRNHSKSRPRRDSDQSPPRRRFPSHAKTDSEKPGRIIKSEAYSRRDSDQSPRRRRSTDRKRKDSDQSPKRKTSPGHKRRSSDQSSPRKRSLNHSSSNRLGNSTGTRIKRENSVDQSPPRRTNNGNPFKTSIKMENPSPNSSPRKRNSESPPPTHKSSSSKMSKTLDGKRAGLQDAQTLRIETEERKRNEDRMFSQMSKEISGRDAEVQVRKSSYRRHRNYIEEDPEVQRQKEEHEEKKKELYTRWNKGVKQMEAIQAKISDDQYEGSKPLARYSNDADLDEMLRQKEREDDPMLQYIRNKKKEQQIAANIPVKPKYKGSYPENRFGIPPGYRWDGVDRSNGYENKWFDLQSSKQAQAEEAYKYSVEEM